MQQKGDHFPEMYLLSKYNSVSNAQSSEIFRYQSLSIECWNKSIYTIFWSTEENRTLPHAKDIPDFNVLKKIYETITGGFFLL